MPYIALRHIKKPKTCALSKKSVGKKNSQSNVLEIIHKSKLERKTDYEIPLKNNYYQFKAKIEAYFHEIIRDNEKSFIFNK